MHGKAELGCQISDRQIHQPARLFVGGRVVEYETEGEKEEIGKEEGVVLCIYLSTYFKIRWRLCPG